MDSFFYNELDIKTLTFEIANKYETEIKFFFKQDHLYADFDPKYFQMIGHLVQDISGLIPLQVIIESWNDEFF